MTIQLKPYIPRVFKQYELMTDEEITNGAGGTLIVDLESYINYFLIAFKDIKTNKIITFEPPFNKHKLCWILNNYQTVGFNSIKFDLPIIWLSYLNQYTEVLHKAVLDLINNNFQKKELTEKYNFVIHNTNHIDLIEICPLKGSLKLYGARLHSPRIQDLPFDVNKPILNEQKIIVKDYCINDLDETHRLFNFLKEHIELRQSMSIQYNENLMSKSDAQIAEKVICKEVQKLTGKYPKRPTISLGTSYDYNIPAYITYQTPVLKKVLEKIRNSKFIVNGNGGISMPREIEEIKIQLNNKMYRMGIGGLHSFEKNVFYKATNDILIIDRDVASYYPSIILTQKLYPKHIGISFLEVYKGLVERRLTAKRTGNKTVDKGLKVAINGSFGKFGNMWSALYSPDLMIQVTLTGQLSLLMLIEAVELVGIQVISANTDGIVMLCPQDKKHILNHIVNKWEQLTGFITEETRYVSYYARDVNAYFAVKKDKSIKLKGPYSEVGSATGTQLDCNPSSLICTDAIKQLLKKEVPIEETICECKDITRFVTIRNVKGGAHKNGYYLGKVVRWYYATDIVGTINYISTNNKVPDTEYAYPCQDLPKEFPINIAYDWYISKTNEILEEIAYYPKKQLSFNFNS